MNEFDIKSFILKTKVPDDMSLIGIIVQRNLAKTNIKLWRKIFKKLPVVLKSYDYSNGLPYNCLIELEVCTTLVAFLNESISDSMTLRLNIDGNIIFPNDNFKQESDDSTFIFEKWKREYFPNNIFPFNFGYKELTDCLGELGILYKEMIPESKD